jgi:hypothetical protein
VASSIPSVFIAFALDAGLWTIDRAIAHAQHCAQGDIRARAHIPLIERTHDRTHLNCIRALIDAISNTNGSPRSHFQAALWEEVFASAAEGLTPEDLQLCYDAIVQIEDAEERLRVLRDFSALRLGQALARAVVTHVSSITVPKGEDLAGAFEAHRINRSKVEVYFRASRHLAIEFKIVEYPSLLNALRQQADAHTMVRALKALSEDHSYEELERKGLLPRFQSLVGECAALCYADKFGGHAANVLLPLVRDGKREFFSRLVKPHLLEDSDYESATKIAQVARENPEFEEELIHLALQRGDFGQVLALAKMLPFSPKARTRLILLGIYSDAVLDPLIEGEGLTNLACSLSAEEIEKLITCITNLPDLHARARGLAQIALAVDPEREDVFVACLENTQQLDSYDSSKAEEVLELLATHRSTRLVRLAFGAAQRARDENACLVAVGSILNCLPRQERPDAISLAIALVPRTGPEWIRMERLSNIVTSTQGELSSDEEVALQKAFEAYCDVNLPERKVHWLVTLAQHGRSSKRAERVEQALLHARATQGRTRVELLCEILPHTSKRTQQGLATEIEQELDRLDLGDRRYAFVSAAEYLDTGVRRRLCGQIVRETPDDKLYALDGLCAVLDHAAANQLCTRVLDVEQDQILPHLATALARLGRLDVALEVHAKASHYRAPDALLGIAPHLDRSHAAAAVALATKIEGNEYAIETRDKVLTAIAYRQFELGEWQAALQISAEISSASVRAATRLRIAPAVSEAVRTATINDALEVCRSTEGYFERAQINTAFLALDATFVPVARLIALFTTNMELAASENRCMSYYTIRAFLPALHARVGSDVASKVFCEIRRIQKWWP